MDDWFAEYGVSHQNSVNKLIHWICVPLIFFSIVALLAAIPRPSFFSHISQGWQPYIHWGTVALLPAWLFYLRRSPAMALGIILFSSLCLYAVKLLLVNNAPLALVALSIFVAAWIGQFIGHKIEGQKPSFFKDLQFLLIGPAWLLGFIYRQLGIRY